MKIDSETIKKLREKTGAGILDCKQALEKSGGDVDKATDRLRVEGLARAAKRQGREAREGVLRLKVTAEGLRAALVELNCETDFVARTAEFQELADWLLEKVMNEGEETLRQPETEKRIKEISGRTGEKISGGRVFLWDKPGFIAAYLHHNGRVAALVELDRADPEAGREVAMQVAVSNPDYLDEESVPAEVADREMEIFRLQSADKPEPLQEKVAVGKWRKRLAEICLLDLPYIRDPKISVRQYLGKRPEGGPVHIRDFLRLRLGDE